MPLSDNYLAPRPGDRGKTRDVAQLYRLRRVNPLPVPSVDANRRKHAGQPQTIAHLVPRLGKLRRHTQQAVGGRRGRTRRVRRGEAVAMDELAEEHVGAAKHGSRRQPCSVEAGQLFVDLRTQRIRGLHQGRQAGGEALPRLEVAVAFGASSRGGSQALRLRRHEESERAEVVRAAHLGDARIGATAAAEGADEEEGRAAEDEEASRGRLGRWHGEEVEVAVNGKRRRWST